jgi:hypothetical protein
VINLISSTSYWIKPSSTSRRFFFTVDHSFSSLLCSFTWHAHLLTPASRFTTVPCARAGSQLAKLSARSSPFSRSFSPWWLPPAPPCRGSQFLPGARPSRRRLRAPPPWRRLPSSCSPARWSASSSAAELPSPRALIFSARQRFSLRPAELALGFLYQASPVASSLSQPRSFPFSRCARRSSLQLLWAAGFFYRPSVAVEPLSN